MAFNRGDVVLIPFPYTDLSATKTRPAIIISSPIYHTTRSELLLAYLSSQLSSLTPPLDYSLVGWKKAGLLKPSFVRPKIAAVDPKLIVYQIGALSKKDLLEVDRRLRLAMSLTDTALADVVNEVDFMHQPPALVQMLAEKSVRAAVSLVENHHTAVNLEKLRQLLLPK